jgi:hypothetical protein
MIYIYFRQSVEDYARWKEDFDNHISARQAGGATDEAFVLRNVDDPNEITIILGWSDLKKAKAFTESASLQEAIKKAGVIGPSEVRFLEAAG